MLEQGGGKGKAAKDPRDIPIAFTIQSQPGAPKYTFTSDTHEVVKAWVKEIHVLTL